MIKTTQDPFRWWLAVVFLSIGTLMVGGAAVYAVVVGGEGAALAAFVLGGLALAMGAVVAFVISKRPDSA